MSRPAIRGSGSGAASCAAARSSIGSKPAIAPPALSRCSTWGVASPIAAASSA